MKVTVLTIFGAACIACFKVHAESNYIKKDGGVSPSDPSFWLFVCELLSFTLINSEALFFHPDFIHLFLRIVFLCHNQNKSSAHHNVVTFRTLRCL